MLVFYSILLIESEIVLPINFPCVYSDFAAIFMLLNLLVLECEGVTIVPKYQ